MLPPLMSKRRKSCQSRAAEFTSSTPRRGAGHKRKKISGRFQAGFRQVSGRFQAGFRQVSGRFQAGFRQVSEVSGRFQAGLAGFRQVSGRFQAGFRQVSGRFQVPWRALQYIVSRRMARNACPRGPPCDVWRASPSGAHLTRLRTRGSRALARERRRPMEQLTALYRQTDVGVTEWMARRAVDHNVPIM